jgi:DNA-binding transcriptional LysR family regulator
MSFTKASEELYITQPAVTKNIKELELEYGVSLFHRRGNKIELTEAGRILLGYTDKIMGLYKQVRYDLDLIKQRFSGMFQIGASTTVGQYVLPALMSLFHTRYPDINLSLINANTREIENYLIDKKIELGIVEGKPKNRRLKYIPFMEDEIVLIAHTSQKNSQKEIISLEEFKKISLVLRELGSGSLEVIRDELKKQGVHFKDLNIAMHLGSTESIKSYLTNVNSVGLVSIAAVNKEIKNGEFSIIDVKGLDIKRMFYFIYNQGVPDKISDMFMKFAVSAI